jgi:hypothetical protein
MPELDREEWEPRSALPVERKIPLVIRAVGLFLGVAAAGVAMSGLYLVVKNGSPGLPLGLTVVGGATGLMLLALRVARLEPSAWSALVVITGLLFASTVYRMTVGPGMTLYLAGEIVLEVAALAYLTRPATRALFRGGGPLSRPS